MTRDIETRKLHEEIAAKLNLDASDIDGDEFAVMFNLKQLAILQKEIAKAIARKVLD